MTPQLADATGSSCWDHLAGITLLGSSRNRIIPQPDIPQSDHPATGHPAIGSSRNRITLLSGAAFVLGFLIYLQQKPGCLRITTMRGRG
jgi:hypothetical protein